VVAAWSEEIRKTTATVAAAMEKSASSECEVIFMGAILTCNLGDFKGWP
jgi:hypothetical protein